MFKDMIDILKNYKPRRSDYKIKKDALVINAQNFYDRREMIIEVFKNKLFPLYSGNYCHDLEEEETPKSDNEESEKGKASVSKLEKKPIDLDKVLNPALMQKYFYNSSLREVAKQLEDLKHQDKTSVEHNNEMALLVVGLTRLEKDIRNIPENEVKNKKLDLLTNTVTEIIHNIQSLENMPDLETEEEATQRKKGQGLKIMTPKQMLLRLPILLAELKAGNNSQKLKN